MSQGTEPNAYLVDAETFSALRRAVRRLHADDPLAGDERRNLASRMGALLQKAQPDHRGSARPQASSELGCSSSVLKDSFWKLRASA
jgi:hypothetical protein